METFNDFDPPFSVPGALRELFLHNKFVNIFPLSGQTSYEEGSCGLWPMRTVPFNYEKSSRRNELVSQMHFSFHSLPFSKFGVTQVGLAA